MSEKADKIAEPDLAKAFSRGIKKAGYRTVRGFGARNGIHQPTLSLWTSGKVEPRYTSIKRVAFALDMRVSDLIRMGEA